MAAEARGQLSEIRTASPASTRGGPHAEFDLAIRGGTVATAADTFRADVGIRGGRIAAVADKVEGARREIDARGLLVLPGGIDSHVHLAQPSGPRSRWPTTSPPAPPPRRRAATPAFCHSRCRSRACRSGNASRIIAARPRGSASSTSAFTSSSPDPTPEVLGQELPALVKAGHTSFKVFMTYDDLVLNDRELLEVFEVARRERALVMVHARATTPSAS